MAGWVVVIKKKSSVNKKFEDVLQYAKLSWLYYYFNNLNRRKFSITFIAGFILELLDIIAWRTRIEGKCMVSEFSLHFLNGIA